MPHITWEMFKHVLLLHNGKMIYDNLFEELSVLHQLGTVDEYIEAFEFISACSMTVRGSIPGLLHGWSSSSYPATSSLFPSRISMACDAGSP